MGPNPFKWMSDTRQAVLRIPQKTAEGNAGFIKLALDWRSQLRRNHGGIREQIGNSV